MVLDLRGQKVLVIGGTRSAGRVLTEAILRKGADVVIWLRKGNHEVRDDKESPITQLELPAQQSNGTAANSLWRQTMLQKSYW